MIPVLPSDVPICMVATARPAFGKTNAHHCGEKLIRRATRRIETVDSAENQMAVSQRKSAAGTDMPRQRSPTGMVVMPRKSFGSTVCAWVPREMRPAQVYAVAQIVSKCCHGVGRKSRRHLPAGPTDTYMPGLVGGGGMLWLINLVRYTT